MRANADDQFLSQFQCGHSAAPRGADKFSDPFSGEERQIDKEIANSIPAALASGGDAIVKQLRVGVSGHRVLADTDKVIAGIDQAITRLRTVFANRPIVVLSSLAEGADRLVAERALGEAAARLFVPLPLPRDEYIWDFKTEQSQYDFLQLLQNADEVLELPPQPSGSQAYLAGGLYVLDHCDVLIAVWDGNEAQGTGGTAEIVAEARRRKLPIAWVHAGNRKPGTNEPTSLGRDQGKVTFENL